MGFEQGQYYILSDKKNPKQQEYFDPFSPKILAMRQPFRDNATEGRLLSISPHETSRTDIPIILLDEYEEETQCLRNEIAVFTLRNWEKINGAKMLSFHNLKIEPRLKQLAMPLSIIFQVWEEGIEPFKHYLQARQLEIKRVRASSWEGVLFNSVYSLATSEIDISGDLPNYYEGSKLKAVTPTMVAGQLRTSPKSVTQGLESIGFQIERKAINLDGRKTTIRMYTVPNEQTWQEIVSRYFYDENAQTDSEIPNMLKSSKYVSREVSHLSHLSQNTPKQQLVDTSDTCDTYTYRENNSDNDRTDRTGTLPGTRRANW